MSASLGANPIGSSSRAILMALALSLVGLSACAEPQPLPERAATAAEASGSAPSSAPAASLPDAALARIRSAVDSTMLPLIAEHDVPGMAVAVTLGGQPLFFTYGVASKESGAQVSEETLFELGSVSKTFTGTLAAYAQELGRLSLEDRPSQHLPQLQGSALDQARLFHLGTYTAGGLPLQFPAEASSEERMLRYLQRWQPDAEPGEQRLYSNPSIGLLGYITGRALGSTFTEAVEGRLLPELGLSHTYIRVPESAMARYAWGYNAENEPVRVGPAVLDAEAYGIKSSASDMIRFVQANIDPSRLEGAVRRAVEATHVGYFSVGEMVQGLGWEHYPYPVTLDQLLVGNGRPVIFEPNSATPLTPPRPPSGPTLFNKTGSTGGFGAYVAFVPERGIGLVMLANKNVPIPARIRAAHQILEQLAAEAR